MAISVKTPAIPQPHEAERYRFLTEQQRYAELHTLIMKRGVEALEVHTGVPEGNHILDKRIYELLTPAQAATMLEAAIESWMGRLKTAKDLTHADHVFDLAVPNDGTDPDSAGTLVIGDGVTNDTVAFADSDNAATILAAIAAILETGGDAVEVSFPTPSIMRVILDADALLADGETPANTVSLL